ncbi:serine hydrolase FSH [Staphylotrichum tortipilum]|uniref:Serine hydrolase FSH n=1 Tax=Staphylotrichum tortipilum TaxID=2831512 RepID=A0AAN6RP26_9PEZI|nr:serine hydrolase FSH [Staphylotrichum longicolle]
MGDIAAPSQPPSRTDSPATQSSRGGTPKPKNNAPPKKPVRILMLHGYTQSGPLFRAKTRALEKLLAKALAPAGLLPTMVYPTAPNRLSAGDIPGYEPRGGVVSAEEGGEVQAEEEIDSWAWFRKDEASGGYRFVREGMERLAEFVGEVVKGAEGEEGGVVDGVVGFSQGGCMAGMLAAVMEEGVGRKPTEGQEGWVNAVREANKGVPLKFAVIYSGFYATPKDLAWMYEPKIRTPTLHFLGSLDTVVEESRSQGLVERCEEPLVLTHPGGHYVPVSKEWAMPLAGFIKKCVEGAEAGVRL